MHHERSDTSLRIETVLAAHRLLAVQAPRTIARADHVHHEHSNTSFRVEMVPAAHRLLAVYVPTDTHCVQVTTMRLLPSQVNLRPL